MEHIITSIKGPVLALASKICCEAGRYNIFSVVLVHLNHEYQMVESVYNESIADINDRLVRYGILEVKKDDEGKTETI